MKMYDKDGVEVTVDKEQVKIMEEAGYSKVAPEPKKPTSIKPSPKPPVKKPVATKLSPE